MCMETCVLTYTYSVRSLFCGEEPRLRSDLFLEKKEKLMRSDSTSKGVPFVIFLKDYRAIVLVS